MKIVIADINILIELHELGVLAEAFVLDHTFYISDFILNGLKNETLKSNLDLLIRTKKIQIQLFGNDELSDVYGIMAKYKMTSLANASSIYMLNGEDVVLLTNCVVLFESFKKFGYTVCSIKWIISELNKAKIVSNDIIKRLCNQLTIMDRESPVKRIEESIKV